MESTMNNCFIKIDKKIAMILRKSVERTEATKLDRDFENYWYLVSKTNTVRKTQNIYIKYYPIL